MTDQRKILCLDVGGSKMLSGVINADGKILCMKKRTLNICTKDEMSTILIQEVEELLKDDSWKSKKDDELSAIGVSIPGLADAKNGKWVYAPFSNIRDFDVRMLLEQKFGIRVFLENDANVCAIGERRFGIAKESDDFLWMTVSNGIGGGLFLNGKIYSGKNLGAGEIGHVKIASGKYRCSCGQYGCLEAYAAGPAIMKRYQERTGFAGMSAFEIAKLARNGEKDAIKVYRDEGIYLAKGISMAVTLLNLPLVVIGGGISNSYDLFIESLMKEIHLDTFENPNMELKVEKTGLGYEASLIGAGALALESLSAIDE